MLNLTDLQNPANHYMKPCEITALNNVPTYVRFTTILFVVTILEPCLFCVVYESLKFIHASEILLVLYNNNICFVFIYYSKILN